MPHDLMAGVWILGTADVAAESGYETDGIAKTSGLGEAFLFNPPTQRPASCAIVAHGTLGPGFDASRLLLESVERRIRWAATSAAERYDVFAYDPTDGRLLFRQETRSPALAAPMTGAGPVIVAVRAHCGDVVGHPAYLAY